MRHPKIRYSFMVYVTYFREEETRKTTLEKALEIMQDIIVEKTTYINTLKYQEQQMKETDLHAASVRTELVKTKERNQGH